MVLPLQLLTLNDVDVVDTIDRCSSVCGRAATFDMAVLAIADGGVVVPVACFCRRRGISRCLPSALIYESNDAIYAFPIEYD